MFCVFSCLFSEYVGLTFSPDTLKSVLETVIYDPFVEWAKSSRPGKGGELENMDAKDKLSYIDMGLNGIVRYLMLSIGSNETTQWKITC